MTAAQSHALKTAFVAVFVFLVAATTSAFDLITKEEASLPSGTKTELRGPFPGPVVEVVLPPSDVGQRSPIRFLVRFKTFAGSPVDKESVRLIYIKNPLIELTPRVRPFITSTGIELVDANVPPGTHTIRVQLKDSAGRTSSKYVTFQVEP